MTASRPTDSGSVQVQAEPSQLLGEEVPPPRIALGSSGIQALAITAVAVGLFAYFSIFAPHFLELSNITSMAKVSSYTFIVAVGLTFLFISAEIDLSVGANLAFAGIVMGFCIVNWNLDPWVGAFVAILAGALVGAVNGVVVTVFGVQAFIVTLGMLSVLGGASLVITNGVPIVYPLNLDSSLFSITNGSVGSIPAPVLWAGGAFIGGVFLLRFTKFGYHVYAVGGNRLAALEMGVRVKTTKFLCFVLTGMLCGCVAVLQSGWLLQADPSQGEAFTLDVIAAIIIGGAALYGGAGSIYGTFVGTAITGMLSTGLILLGLNAAWPTLVKGILIILIVSMSVGLRRIRRRSGPRRRPGVVTRRKKAATVPRPD